jgi:predicted PurR-regulated permease PerM
MTLNRIVEYSFFFGLLLGVAYFVWLILSPFLPALALSAVIVTICYPVYRRILRFVPRNSEAIAAGLTTIFALVIIVIPVFFASSVLVSEVFSFYQALSQDDGSAVMEYLAEAESALVAFAPGFELDLPQQITQAAQWFAGNLGALFAGTASMLFLVLISIIGIFYSFRDGERFTRWIVRVSPLPDEEDEVILARLALAVRSVVTGVVLVSIIQGVVAAIGFSLFGIERAVLWASVAAIAALLPGIGTSFIMVPAVLFLFFVGDFANAVGLLVWSVFAVILIDNFIGPTLMSRGNRLHPFVILLAVLGGISMFGPIGFVIGPVIVSLFMVLLEIYSQNINLEGFPETRDNE